ncbi:MAG: aminotransferase class I/II-fold pyridoxal phosphate-dependent enzyme [Gemmatimonadota bacterium]|nr:aminotransferase class I/II-fold pyridoxal phosphate-dependent enzyme [Gemmatimonadota bacterium]
MTHRLDDALQAKVQTLVDVLEYRAARQGEEQVFTFLGGAGEVRGARTFGELQTRARALAVRLSECTIPGDRVVLLVPPGLDYVTAFFACLYAGVVAVPAYPPNPRRADPRVSRIVSDCGARVALASPELMARLDGWLALVPELRSLQWLDVAEAQGGDATLWQAPDVTSDALAMLQYTSGSTGNPRGVQLTHGNLLANLAVIHQVNDFREGDQAVFWIPPFHDMGLIGGVLEPIYAAIPTALLAPASFLQRPALWLEVMSRRRATITGGPNFAFDLCVERIAPEERAALDLSSWRLCFNGAEPVQFETMRRFAEAFRPSGFNPRVMLPCYGLAEATLFVAGGPAGRGAAAVFVDRDELLGGTLAERSAESLGAQALVTAGVPAPGTDVVIVDLDGGEALPEGRVGEIWVSGPSVSLGYWNRPELEGVVRAKLPGRTERFLRTGDLGAMLHGDLVVTGRLKDIIILHGRNYYPQDLELATTQSHAILRRGYCAAFTVPDATSIGAVERLVIAAEVGRHHDSASDRHVFQSIRQRLGAASGVTPDEILLVRAGGIPRTSSGKLQRRACRAAFLAGTLDTVGHWRVPERSAVTPVDATVAFVLDWIAQETGTDVSTLSADASPRDLGLDSIGMTLLAVALEERVGRRLATMELWEQPSVRAVVAHALRAGLGAGREERAAALPLPAETTDFARWPEVRALAERQRGVAGAGLASTFFRPHDGMAGRESVVEGQTLLNFASYNYLGLGGHPDVLRAAHDAIARWGTSASASRLVSGERAVHREIEEALASFTGVPAALAFVGGHATNVTTIAHLLGPDDLVLCDALLHNSAMVGAAQSGARQVLFPHNDWEALDALLRRLRPRHRRALVIIEGVYSADGDIPDLARFLDVKARHHALLMVDEAHSLGVIGETGRGLAEHAGVDPRSVDIWMGTLSKALASCGGYIAGRADLVDYLRYTAPGFVFSVGMTPANAAAALAALQVLRAEPERVTTLRRVAAGFVSQCRARGIDVGASQGSAIVPVIVGDAEQALRLSSALRERGVEAPPMLPPAVPDGQARVRFFVSSAHREADVARAVEALADAMAAAPTAL